MKLPDLKIGDRILDRDALAQPAVGFEVVGTDPIGIEKHGPCVILDWEGRFDATGQGFRVVRTSELEHWEFVVSKSDIDV